MLAILPRSCLHGSFWWSNRVEKILSLHPLKLPRRNNEELDGLRRKQRHAEKTKQAVSIIRFLSDLSRNSVPVSEQVKKNHRALRVCLTAFRVTYIADRQTKSYLSLPYHLISLNSTTHKFLLAFRKNYTVWCQHSSKALFMFQNKCGTRNNGSGKGLHRDWNGTVGG